MKKILVVEDDAPLRNALTDKLTREGFEVIVAINGKEALEKVGEADLVLLDIIMPYMDGISVLKQFKSDKIDIPVIMLTNLSESDKVIEALDNGAFDYLVKSDWQIDDVVTKVKEKLNV